VKVQQNTPEVDDYSALLTEAITIAEMR